MQEYLLAAAAAGALIEGIDIAHSAARLEMYGKIKYMDTDKKPSDNLFVRQKNKKNA